MLPRPQGSLAERGMAKYEYWRYCLDTGLLGAGIADDPGSGIFYGGLVRRKNATATIMHSLMCMGLVGMVWVLWGYSLASVAT